MEEVSDDGVSSIYKFVGDAKRLLQNLFAGHLTAIDLMVSNVLRVASCHVEEAGQKLAESKVAHRVACKKVEDAKVQLSQLGLFAFSKKGQLRELIDQKGSESKHVREELEAKDARLGELQKRIDDLCISTADIEALEREADELKVKVDVAAANLERAKGDERALEALVSEVKRTPREADHV